MVLYSLFQLEGEAPKLQPLELVDKFGQVDDFFVCFCTCCLGATKEKLTSTYTAETKPVPQYTDVWPTLARQLSDGVDTGCAAVGGGIDTQSKVRFA